MDVFLIIDVFRVVREAALTGWLLARWQFSGGWEGTNLKLSTDLWVSLEVA